MGRFTSSIAFGKTAPKHSSSNSTKRKIIKPGTCLITGGAGFIGSHLAETLLAEGHKVLAIDDFSTGSWQNIAHLGNNPNFQFARSSIEDPVVLDRMASQAQVI